MRIIVVGGNGFIGSHFVARAIAGGHDVLVSGNNPVPRFAHGLPFTFLPGGLEALSGNAELLGSVDAVCHFASNSIPSSSNADPVGDIAGNLMTTVGLLEAMRRAGTRRIIYLSSGGAIYGRPVTSPMSESHPTDPLSSYGVVKLANEKYLNLYAEQHGFRPTIIRPANPYGPGQGTIGQLGAVTTFINLALSGQRAVIWGDGSAIRDFVYISDLCDMALTALENEVTGVFNCASGSGTSLTELIALVEEATGLTLDREYRPARAFDPPAVVLDIGRARDTMGWSPQVGLREGIRQTLAALEN